MHKYLRKIQNFPANFCYRFCWTALHRLMAFRAYSLLIYMYTWILKLWLTWLSYILVAVWFLFTQARGKFLVILKFVSEPLICQALEHLRGRELLKVRGISPSVPVNNALSKAITYMSRYISDSTASVAHCPGCILRCIICEMRGRKILQYGNAGVNMALSFFVLLLLPLCMTHAYIFRVNFSFMRYGWSLFFTLNKYSYILCFKSPKVGFLLWNLPLSRFQ